jgi:hypothetical protein
MSAPAPPSWAYLDTRSWVPYDARTSAALEAEFVAPTGRPVIVRTPHVVYEVSVSTMKQRNTKTGFVRPIKRLDATAAAPLAGMLINNIFFLFLSCSFKKKKERTVSNNYISHYGSFRWQVR